MINKMILFLKYILNPFLMIFLAPLSIVYTFRNLLDLSEYVLMLMT